jgi:putative DNA primase/helicase
MANTNNDNTKQEKKLPRFHADALIQILNDQKMTVSYEPVKKDVIWTWHYNDGSRKLIDAKLINHIQQNYSGYTDKKFANCVKIVSMENEHNVILEMIDLEIWDGHNYLEDLYNILHISPLDTLSRILIFKWIWQGIVLLENDEDKPVGADGCLVLTGLQGIGKTSFFRQLAIDDNYFGEGCTYNHRDKDTSIDIVKNFVSELGEIETTFRSDIEALKNFVTKAKDRIRFPYDAKTSEMARRTNLCGTCNSKGFLIDQNGNRRFWTVPIEKIDLKKLREFNSLQLWAQIREQTIMLPQQDFRLSQSEREQLEERNREYMKYLPVEAEIRDIFEEVETKPDAYVWEEMTVSQWKECHPRLCRTSSDKIGRVLQKLGIDESRKRLDGIVSRIRKLPKFNGYTYQ